MEVCEAIERKIETYNIHPLSILHDNIPKEKVLHSGGQINHLCEMLRINKFFGYDSYSFTILDDCHICKYRKAKGWNFEECDFDYLDNPNSGNDERIFQTR